MLAGGPLSSAQRVHGVPPTGLPSSDTVADKLTERAGSVIVCAGPIVMVGLTLSEMTVTVVCAAAVSSESLAVSVSGYTPGPGTVTSVEIWDAFAKVTPRGPDQRQVRPPSSGRPSS